MTEEELHLSCTQPVSELRLSTDKLLACALSDLSLSPSLSFEPFVGTDIEDIDRWRRLLPKLDSDLGKRIFFPEEHDYCRSYADSATRYAGRWCAKEAVFKALSHRYRLLVTDLKILSDSDGRPVVDLADHRFRLNRPIIRLSISHSDSTAIAFALALLPSVSSQER